MGTGAWAASGTQTRLAQRSAFEPSRARSVASASVWSEDQAETLLTRRSVFDARRASQIGAASVSDRAPAGVPQAADLARIDRRSDYSEAQLASVNRRSDPGALYLSRAVDSGKLGRTITQRSHPEGGTAGVPADRDSDRIGKRSAATPLELQRLLRASVEPAGR